VALFLGDRFGVGRRAREASAELLSLDLDGLGACLAAECRDRVPDLPTPYHWASVPPSAPQRIIPHGPTWLLVPGQSHCTGDALSATMGTMLATVRSLILCWRLLWEPRISPLLKLIPLAALAYAISPVDLLADWALPGIGVLDDVTVVLIAARIFLALVPRRIILDHYYWMSHPRKRRRSKRASYAIPE
jgi:uncharacterized membrane protein YkvA (DUF1232 family)